MVAIKILFRKISRNRIGTVFVIKRKKCSFLEFCVSRNSLFRVSERNGMEFRVILYIYKSHPSGMYNLHCDGSFKRHAIPAALKVAAQLWAIVNSSRWYEAFCPTAGYHGQLGEYSSLPMPRCECDYKLVRVCDTICPLEEGGAYWFPSYSHGCIPI